MGAIISLLVVLYLSLFITRIATLILVHTGVSRQTASFQARSAMTGCGFTTSEAENMLNHPLRRRVIKILMLLGHIGIVATMSTAILGFMSASHTSDFFLKSGILVIGLLLLWLISQSRVFEKYFDYFLTKLLKSQIDTQTDNIYHLCHLDDNFKVAEFALYPEHFLIGKRIADIDFKSYTIMLLGIQLTDGKYLGVPPDNIVFEANHVLTLYGNKSKLKNFCETNKTN